MNNILNFLTQINEIVNNIVYDKMFAEILDKNLYNLIDKYITKKMYFNELKCNNLIDENHGDKLCKDNLNIIALLNNL